MNLQATQESVPVLFVLPTLGTGGSERVVFNLCLHLRNHCLPVVAAFRGGALSQELADAGIDHYVLERSGGIDFSLIFKLIRIIRKHRIRVVNCHHFVALFYTFWAARLTRIPLMHTEHSKWEMERLSSFWNWWFQFFLKHIQLATAVSQASFSHLRDVYCVPESRLALVLNGVDVENFERKSHNPISRNELGFYEDDDVVGSVGNLREEKNQGLLVRALAVLKQRGYFFKAVLVGDGPCRDDLEQLAQQIGVGDQVVFLGIRSDVDRLYGLFNFYSLSSRYEGLPLTLLEAMAAGVPVVGTDVLGIREVIQTGVNGLLVEDNDPEALADALLLLKKDQVFKASLVENGCKFVRKKYSLNQFVECYDGLFADLAG